MNTSYILTQRCEVTSSSEERADLKDVEQVVCGRLGCFFLFPRGLGFCLSVEGRRGLLRVAQSAGRSPKSLQPTGTREYQRSARRSPSPGPPRFASPFPALLHSQLGRVPIVCAGRPGPPGSPHPPPFVRAPGSRSTVSLHLPVECVSDRSSCFSGLKSVSEL